MGESRTILTDQMLTQFLSGAAFQIEATWDEGVLVHWGDELYVIKSVTLERGFSPRLVLDLYARETCTRESPVP
jgi:hypothetical protein